MMNEQNKTKIGKISPTNWSKNTLTLVLFKFLTWTLLESKLILIKIHWKQLFFVYNVFFSSFKTISYRNCEPLYGQFTAICLIEIRLVFYTVDFRNVFQSSKLF